MKTRIKMTALACLLIATAIHYANATLTINGGSLLPTTPTADTDAKLHLTAR